MKTTAFAIGCVLFALGLSLAGCQRGGCCKSAASPTPVQESVESKPLFAEGLVNWQPIQFGGEGEVFLEDSVINLDLGGPMTAIRYTGDMTELFGEELENYEISLDAQRVEGNDMFLGLTFPVGHEGHVSLVLGGWAGAITGISNLDGLNASENATTKYRRFEDKAWYKVRIVVTPTEIACWLDGEQIVDVDREGYEEFSVHMMVEDTVPFGLFTYQTWGAYRDLRIKRLD